MQNLSGPIASFNWKHSISSRLKWVSIKLASNQLFCYKTDIINVHLKKGQEICKISHFQNFMYKLLLKGTIFEKFQWPHSQMFFKDFKTGLIHFSCIVILNLNLFYIQLIVGLLLQHKKTLDFIYWERLFISLVIKHLLKYLYCYLQASVSWLVERLEIKIGNRIIIAFGNISIGFFSLFNSLKKQTRFSSNPVKTFIISNNYIRY